MSTSERDTLIELKHGLEKARIWGGQRWVYNPLSFVHYLPLLELVKNRLEELDKKE